MIKDWLEEYNRLWNKLPPEGTLLGTLSGRPAKILVETKPNAEPFLYAIAYIPKTVGSPLGWYLRDIEDDELYGLKCILLPKAQHRIYKNKTIHTNRTEVSMLKVQYQSTTGRSLVVDIEEL